jgi:hypothetical protein
MLDSPDLVCRCGNRAAEFVILLPQISLDQFNCGREPQECGVATGKPVVVCGKRLTG